MKIISSYSAKSEAVRVIASSYYVATGFYHEHQFLILDPQDKVPGWNTVWLPNLPYHTIPNYWEQVKTINTDSPSASYPPILTNAISLMLSKHYSLSLPHSPFFTSWQQHSHQIIQALQATFPSITKQINQITIYTSQFGTNASFTIPSRFPADIEIWIRIDQSVTSLVEAIISSIVSYPAKTTLHAKWTEIELLVDWFIFESPIATLLAQIESHPLTSGTLQSLRLPTQNQLLEKSLNYQRLLGLPHSSHEFSLHNSRCFVNQKPLQGLSARDQSLLSQFILHQNQCLSIDDLAEIIYANQPDNFELASVNKIIERLRKKLQKNNIPPACLVTIRNQGYCLKP